MYCTTCGKELPDGASVCDECGTVFTSDGKSIRPRQTDEASGKDRPYMSYQSYSEQGSYKQPYDYSSPYNNETSEGRTGLAIASLVLGIIGLCGCCLPIISIPIGIIGLIFSILGLRSRYRGLAIAGMVLSIITILFSIMMILAVIVSDSSYYWSIH